MKIKEKRFFLFWVGLLMTVLSVLLALTPIHWEIERFLTGVNDEYYPEMFWLIFMLPLSVLVLFAGMVFGFLPRIKKIFAGGKRQLNGVY